MDREGDSRGPHLIRAKPAWDALLHQASSVPVLVWAGAIAWATWPVPTLAPAGGLDPSWAAGLYMAAKNGLDFGTEIVFTYGPLGWLTIPRLYYRGLAIAAFVTTGAIHLGACWLILRRILTSFGVPLGLLLAYLAATSLKTLQAADVVPLIAFLLALAVILEPRMRTVMFYPILAGSLAAVALLMKLNAGVIALAIGVVTIMTLREPLKKLLIYLGAVVVTFTLAWVATGQSLGAILEFFRTGFEISSGYSSAMGIEPPDRRVEYLGVPIAVALTALVIHQARSLLPDLKNHLALYGITVIMLFASFKHGFVRHDAHAIIFFATSVVVVIGLCSTKRKLISVAVVGSLYAMFMLSTQFPVFSFINPISQLRGLPSQALELAGSRGVRLQEESRQQIRAAYGISVPMYTTFVGSEVHVEPWEAALAWTYPEVSWDPLPVFQAYSAYTSELDGMNAEALESSEGPEFILREGPVAIDLRNPDFESPEANLQLICHFHEIEADARWQLLQRTADRCGEPQHLTAISARGGEIVTVPTVGPNELLFVTIDGVEDSLLANLRTALYKSDIWFVALDEEVFRFVPGHAENPHVLRVPVSVDYSGAFAIEPAETISVSTSPVPGDLGDPGIRYDFYSVPISQ